MKRIWLFFVPGLLLGGVLVLTGSWAIEATSTDKFCNSCHVHPQAELSWKKSVHYTTESGYRVHCVECHLPPKGQGYLPQKAKTGLKDLWGYLFKDSASFDWDAKSKLEYAKNIAPESACLNCHPNLYPATLSKDGSNAHLYYDAQKDKGEDIRCINCHLNAGHYDKTYSHTANTGFGKETVVGEVFTEPAKVEKFESFVEKIPTTDVSFKMVAIPGGTFTMGSPDDEPYHKSDEGPVKEVTVSQFYMAEVEVSWDEFLAYYAQTARPGKTAVKYDLDTIKTVDAIIGATPPYGQPDQNWGKGKRPVISASYTSALTYCKWLSIVTGKKYRLPTEAEWEYAARGGKETPYFFEGNPESFVKSKFLSKKKDTTMINRYVVYKENSQAKTQEPSFVLANPYGLKNMLGNVAEFCSDWYAPDTYSRYKEPLVDPKGPAKGTEHVVRGGSYKSPADQVRVAARESTHTQDWLRTDPQSPKSIWWYSDCFFVGFRVVCEYDANTGKVQ
ncbi:MAG: SUMF1/EgtB/PvdO family nonheme iron enzyme [Bacteroidales bacterium]|nr:SUMF1/EgtB/PvdO family nonheme iron enzyme [Bacteroidales bacterium]